MIKSLTNSALLIFLLMPLSSVLATNSYPELDTILTQSKAPKGVVFEVVEWKDDALAVVIPWLNTQIDALRTKFPDLAIAIVSHGGEQFALLNSNKESNKGIHSSVQRLITDHDIKLEICLGHAQMRGFNASDFPDYVTIEQSGPNSIMEYEDIGFEVVTY